MAGTFSEEVEGTESEDADGTDSEEAVDGTGSQKEVGNGQVEAGTVLEGTVDQGSGGTSPADTWGASSPQDISSPLLSLIYHLKQDKHDVNSYLSVSYFSNKNFAQAFLQI